MSTVHPCCALLRRAAICRAAAAILFLCIIPVPAHPAGMIQREKSTTDLEAIGKRIWQNECNGRVDGLTSWNVGEDFASLGIGHFIWYPVGKNGPFEESFPKLVAWLQMRKVTVPEWLREARGCPWPDRATFLKDRDSSHQKQLRELLSTTVAEQTLFIIDRLEAASPRFESAAGSAGKRVAANMKLLRLTPAGNFAMIDYVNFKGEGLKREERYKGEGWGLLQVLTEMEATDADAAPRAFADAAKEVLTRRVKNSPPERKEIRWLDGWLNRCDRYGR